MTTRDHRTYWRDVALKHLQGRTIVDAFYLSANEREAIGWDQSGIILILDNNAQILVQQDDEGNGPGALSIDTPDSHVLLPTIR
jgi:hypothetical protein